MILGAMPAWCGTLVLESGKTYEGTIIRESDHHIMFRMTETGQVQGFLKENIQRYADADEIPSEDTALPVPQDPLSATAAAADASVRSAPQGNSPPASSNVLRIYGNKIIDENSEQVYEEPESSVFYVSKEKGVKREIIESPLFENGQAATFSVAILVFMFVLYIVACVPFYLIAKKTSAPHPHFAWFPVFNFYLLCTIAGRPGWWLLLMFVPLVNIVIFVVIWMDIATACGKPSWVGLLILVPVVSLVMQWYLALTAVEGVAPKSEKQVPLVDEENAEEAKEQALFDQIVPPDSQDKPKRF
jgi:hypothetical protein